MVFFDRKWYQQCVLTFSSQSQTLRLRFLVKKHTIRVIPEPQVHAQHATEYKYIKYCTYVFTV